MEQQQRRFEHLDSLSPPQPSEYLRITPLESSKTTLWMGDLEPWMEESYIRQLWVMMGEHVLVKLIRDKRTGISSGYAFVDFNSTFAAQNALATLHSTRMPNTQRVFRLNWAAGGGIHDRKEDRAPEFSLFVGDLSGDVDESFLLTLFQQRYPSCHSAKVMTDPVSGLPRGYGFVRFFDAYDQHAALVEMNGVFCGQRQMRVSLATPKNSTSNTSDNIIRGSSRYQHLVLQAPALVQQPTDPSNTTVFVGGLPSPVAEDELHRLFAPYGEIVYIKIPLNKGCGFVQYVSRQSAELAIEEMNGFPIRSSRIRLSWGRSQNDKAIVPTTATVAVNSGGTSVASAGLYARHGMTNSAHLHSPPSLFRYQQPGSMPTSTTSNSLMDVSYGPKSVDSFGSFSPPGHGLARSQQLSPPPPPLLLSVHHHHRNNNRVDLLVKNHHHGGRLSDLTTNPTTGPTTDWFLSNMWEPTTSATATTPSSTWHINSIYAQ